MSTFTQRLQQAEALIKAARDEETPDGNPLRAAHYYTTAMEIVATVGDEVPISNEESRRFFLYQLRQRMEMYFKRVELLLEVVQETGLVDKPCEKSGLEGALQLLQRTGTLPPFSTSLSPPPLYGGAGAASHSATAAISSSNAVMGIPIESTGSNSDNLSVQYFFSQPPQVPAVPPVTEERPHESLDSLFDELTFGEVKKK